MNRVTRAIVVFVLLILTIGYGLVLIDSLGMVVTDHRNVPRVLAV